MVPEYMACTVTADSSSPSGIEHIATPPLRLTVSPPVQASVSAGTKLNVTVPVGVPFPGLTAETVAVNVTALPAVAGLLDDMRAVFVVAA